MGNEHPSLKCPLPKCCGTLIKSCSVNQFGPKGAAHYDKVNAHLLSALK